MDEKTYEFLKANGYDYSFGAILDKNGNYLSILKLKGKTITSETDFETYDRINKANQKNSKDPNKDIIDFKKDPLNTTLSEKAKIYYPEYEEIIIEEKKKLNRLKLQNTTKEIPDTSSFSFNDLPKVSYEYPIFLASSILIYLIIKRFLK